MNGQFLNVKKEEGLSPVKHVDFVPAKINVKLIPFACYSENKNNDNYEFNQKYMQCIICLNHFYLVIIS